MQSSMHCMLQNKHRAEAKTSHLRAWRLLEYQARDRWPFSMWLSGARLTVCMWGTGCC